MRVTWAVTDEWSCKTDVTLNATSPRVFVWGEGDTITANWAALASCTLM